LANLYNTKQATGSEFDSEDLGHYWMTRQDLMSYVLLGDPAVRLPVYNPSLAQKAAASSADVASVRTGSEVGTSQAYTHAEISSFFGMDVLPSRSPVESLLLPLDQLEGAIIKYRASEVLDGGSTAAQIAEKYGLSLRDLKHYAELYCGAGRAALTRKG
jgi:hypothetical protein